MKTYRIFSNDRGTYKGVPLYSAVADSRAASPARAIGQEFPDYYASKLKAAPMVAIEWPVTTRKSAVWLKKHVDALGNGPITPPAKPFKFTRPAVIHSDDAWVCGFGLALAEMNRRWDQPSTCFEVARDAGLTDIKQFKKAGLDEFDLRELRKILKEKKR